MQVIAACIVKSVVHKKPLTALGKPIIFNGCHLPRAETASQH